MFRSLMILLRGRAAEAEEAFEDAHALPILRQQLRECAQAVSAARKALALAIAQHGQEEAQLQRLDTRIADLEERAVAALGTGHGVLAEEAAETIARLETERDETRAVLARLKVDLDRLRASVATSESRLRALKRGQRMAVATDRAQRLSVEVPEGPSTALREAEATLARLRARQTEIDATEAALDEMQRDADPDSLRDRLAAVGCGAPLRTTAAAVLERLRAKSATPA